MPRVLGVHGIAQQFKGGYQLGTVWFDALRDGLVAAGYRPVASSLLPADVRVAFFGDLFRPKGAMAGGEPPYTAADVKPGPERDLLAEFYQVAVEQDPSLGPPPGAMGPGKVAAQAMLDRLLRSRTFARVAQRGFIGNLKQVTAFLTTPDVKERVLQRVAAELTPDTQIIIGHSLGSVVVYEYIARHRPPQVELLVTLGSPLGIPNLVFDKLTPGQNTGLAHGRAQWRAGSTWLTLTTSWRCASNSRRCSPLRAERLMSKITLWTTGMSRTKSAATSTLSQPARRWAECCEQARRAQGRAGRRHGNLPARCGLRTTARGPGPGSGRVAVGRGDPDRPRIPRQTEAAYKYLLNPGIQKLRESVRAAAGAAPVVVIYYTGHGLQPEGDPYYLITTETRPALLEETALEARQLLRLVLRKDAHGGVLPGDEQPQVLIILDCCFPGASGLESLRESLEGRGNPKVWWLASASSVEYAQQVRFAEALKQCLLDPDVGPSQQLLGLDWVTEKINGSLADTEQKARWFPPGGQVSGLPPFFPNPKYVPGVAGLTVAEQHWVSRLRGAPADSATAGFYVTGRTGRFLVVEDLASWMRHPDRGGLAVVTGSPGCGKSAMLALPVLLTDAQGRDALVAGVDSGSLLARAADLFDASPVLGIHARGMNPYQVAEAIAHYLGRTADSPGELLEDLDDHPEPSPPIVVIDAADEARDPQRLLTDLVLPLARRGLQIVIGARRHVLPQPPTPA